MSVTRAALKAGYSEQNPGQSGYQALKAVRAKAPELLDRQDLTDDALSEKHLKPMLCATRTVFVKHEGKVTDEREVIAWGPRIASLSAMTIMFDMPMPPVIHPVAQPDHGDASRGNQILHASCRPRKESHAANS